MIIDSRIEGESNRKLPKILDGKNLTVGQIKLALI